MAAVGPGSAGSSRGLPHVGSPRPVEHAITGMCGREGGRPYRSSPLSVEKTWLQNALHFHERKEHVWETYCALSVGDARA